MTLASQAVCIYFSFLHDCSEKVFFLSSKWYDRLWKCLWWQRSLILSGSLDGLQKCLFLHIIHQTIHRIVYLCKLTQEKIDLVFYAEEVIFKFLALLLYNRTSTCKVSHSDVLRLKRKTGFYYLKKKRGSFNSIYLCESRSVFHRVFCFVGVACPAPAEPQSLQLSSVHTQTDGCPSTWLLTGHGPLPPLPTSAMHEGVR